MLPYVYHALYTFRKVFTRHSTCLTFCVVVLGFLGATHIDGVSSWCRFWHLETPGYVALLHFFRSSAWSLTGLLSCWGAIGLLIGTLAEPFCLPLALRIHQGFTHLRQQDTTDNDPETSATRLVHMALDFA